MDDAEVLRTPLDKRRVGKGFPGEGYRRRAGGSDQPGRSCVWKATEAQMFEPAPVWGAFPKGFVDFAIRVLRCPRSQILHMCSGALGREVGGTRVDMRQEARPDVRADARQLPFRDGAFSGVLIDPPYSLEYARELYNTDYPRPSHLLREASRVCAGGGRVGFVHFLVPHSSGTKLTLERTYGVVKGCGYRIVAFTVFMRDQIGLFE